MKRGELKRILAGFLAALMVFGNSSVLMAADVIPGNLTVEAGSEISSEELSEDESAKESDSQSEENSEELSEDVSEENSEEQSEEVSEENSEEVTEEESEEVSEENSEEASEEESEDVSEENSEEVSEEDSENLEETDVTADNINEYDITLADIKKVTYSKANTEILYGSWDDKNEDISQRNPFSAIGSEQKVVPQGYLDILYPHAVFDGFILKGANADELKKYYLLNDDLSRCLRGSVSGNYLVSGNCYLENGEYVSGNNYVSGNYYNYLTTDTEELQTMHALEWDEIYEYAEKNFYDYLHYGRTTKYASFDIIMLNDSTDYGEPYVDFSGEVTITTTDENRNPISLAFSYDYFRKLGCKVKIVDEKGEIAYTDEYGCYTPGKYKVVISADKKGTILEIPFTVLFPDWFWDITKAEISDTGYAMLSNYSVVHYEPDWVKYRNEYGGEWELVYGEDYYVVTDSVSADRKSATITIVGRDYYIGSITKTIKLENTAFAEVNYVLYEANPEMGGYYENRIYNPNPEFAEYGKKIPLKPAVRVGYEFLGWYSDAKLTKKVTEMPNPVNGVITLYPKWKRCVFSLDLSDVYPVGTLDVNSRQYYYAGSEVKLPIPEIRDEYAGYLSFGGWYLDEAYTKKVTKIMMGYKDVKLYPKWVPAEYKILFEKGVLDGTMSAVSLYADGYVTLPSCKFKKTGYTVTGWKLKGTDLLFDLNDKVLAREIVSFLEWDEKYGYHVTLVAQARNTYSVSYDMREGVLDSELLQSYTYGLGDRDGKEYVLPKPERYGYNFVGWYDVKTNKQVKKITKTTKGDFDLYAKWSPWKITVVYHKNGADLGSMKNQTVYYGDSFVLNNKFVKKGYKLINWSFGTKQDDAVYGDGITITVNEAFCKKYLDDSMKLNAVANWMESNYSVAYYSELGNTIELPYTYGKEQELLVPEPVAGYTFAGWYKDPNFKSKITKISNKQYGDLNLYAKWTAKYEIRFHKAAPSSEEVTGTMKTFIGKYESKTKLPANKFACKGYAFDGWQYSFGSPNLKDRDTLLRPRLQYDDQNKVLYYDLYASWRSSFNVAFIIDDEIKYIQNYEYGKGMSDDALQKIASNYQKPNHQFLGWYEGKKKITSISAKEHKDYDLVAKYKSDIQKNYFKANAPGKLKTKGKTSTISMNYDDSYVVPECGYTLKGYQFMGWSLNENGEGTRYYPGETLTPQKNGETGWESVTYYAIWEKETYTCTIWDSEWVYEGEHGWSKYEINFTVDDEIHLNSMNFIKPGYRIEGIYYDENFKRKVKNNIIPKGTAQNLDLYIKWKPSL